MRDALGAVQSVLILGGTSEIALATVRRMVDARTRSVILAVRDPASAIPAADELRRLGATRVEVSRFEATDTDSHAAAIDEAFALGGDIDLVLVAIGVLGDQETFDTDPATAVEAIGVNYTGAVSACLHVARHIRRQGHGSIVVLSSVGGVRARKSNYVYGSTKSGLDTFAQGLGDALLEHGGRVMVVRPGFVHTRMTHGMAEQPFSVTPEQVADAIIDGLQRNREIVWAPPILQWVFLVLANLPRRLWRIIAAR